MSCSCGHVYIQETKRALETRIKEHKTVTRQGETEKLAIAEHTWGQHHPILWEETSVLDQAPHCSSKRLYTSASLISS